MSRKIYVLEVKIRRRVTAPDRACDCTGRKDICRGSCQLGDLKFEISMQLVPALKLMCSMSPL